MDIQAERKALRARLVLARLELDPVAHARASEAISALLAARLAPFAGKCLAAYWPHRREYDPIPVAKDFLAAGGEAALPKVAAKGSALEFHRWHPDLDMLIGLYEIPYPSGGKIVRPDIILVPMVGFDSRGYRLGYGGGYYDRTLAGPTPRPLAIGVGFELGRVDTIHPQAHDVPLDMVVTEAGVFGGS
jgi:5-formyltetrahydrofolate cyclo-ligase